MQFSSYPYIRMFFITNKIKTYFWELNFRINSIWTFCYYVLNFLSYPNALYAMYLWNYSYLFTYKISLRFWNPWNLSLNWINLKLLYNILIFWRKNKKNVKIWFYHRYSAKIFVHFPGISSYFSSLSGPSLPGAVINFTLYARSLLLLSIYDIRFMIR